MGRMDTLVENVKQLLEFARICPNEDEWSEKEVKIPRPMLVDLAQEVQQYEKDVASPQAAGTQRQFVQNRGRMTFKMPGEDN